jgi:hypothetical protein
VNTSAEAGWAHRQCTRPARDDEDHQEEAARLDRDNPWWLIVWGTFSRQFVAFPLFHVPQGTILCCRSSLDLIRRMRQVDQIYGDMSRDYRPADSVIQDDAESGER